MRGYGRGGGDYWGGDSFGRGGGGGGRGRPGFRGGRGGPRRMLARAELQLLVLSLVATEPRHGYDLIRAIEDISNGAYAPSPGVIYPALADLEEQGKVAVDDQGNGRKVFSITLAGEKDVAENDELLAGLKTRLASFRHVNAEELSPIRRAMDNLKMVLGNATTNLENDRAFEIASLIDEAAQKIERLR